MAHGLFSLQCSRFSFALDGFLPNCWKSRSFHPLNGFLCHFLVLTLRWGAPSGTTAEKVAISMLFPLQESLIFMISALTEPNPVSFVHCQGFLRNSSMSLHTNRWHMAYFLCNFQGFPLLWAASAISFLSMGFSAIFYVFLCFGRLLPKMLKRL